MLDEKLNLNDFLQIRYYAFGYKGGVEDFAEIDSFKESIDESYKNFVRVKPIGRGGGAYELAIHYITNLQWQDYLAGFVFKKVVLEPVYERLLELINAYSKLKDRNPILDCYSLHVEFQDFDIYIYKTSENSLLPNLNKIMSEVHNHRDKIQEIMMSKVTEVHIPVIEDVSRGQELYRTPIGEAENMKLAENDLFGFWGIKYNGSQMSAIYELSNKDFIENREFYTDEEFYKKFF
jgi:hypothetical protein